MLEEFSRRGGAGGLEEEWERVGSTGGSLGVNYLETQPGIGGCYSGTEFRWGGHGGGPPPPPFKKPEVGDERREAGTEGGLLFFVLEGGDVGGKIKEAVGGREEEYPSAPAPAPADDIGQGSSFPPCFRVF